MDFALLRILDANANRAAEGLRVVEEYFRFVAEDPGLTRQLKGLRHDLAAQLARPELQFRWQSRDARGDIGAEITVPSESERPDSRSVVKASLQRVPQALRCLEEYAKPISREAGLAFERLRFRAYELESMIQTQWLGCDRLAGCQLYVLVDGGRDAEDFAARIQAILAGGAHAIQLRDKSLDDRQLLARAAMLRKLTRDRAIFLVNDRVDLCVAADADGVHLGQDDMPVAAARRLLAPHQLVGVSTHNLDQLRGAITEGASYVGCGPTFPSQTKRFDNFPGLEYLKEAISETGLPLFAIGGIDVSRIPTLHELGVSRVAVSAAVWSADNPESAARELVGALEAAPSNTK